VSDPTADPGGPVPLRATRACDYRIAVLVTSLGLPVVARYAHQARCWDVLWGFCRGRTLRANAGDEGRWMEQGDIFGPLPDGTEVVVGEFDVTVRPVRGVACPEAT
jgi:hypothetical protein